MHRVKPKSHKERNDIFDEKQKNRPSIHLSSADFPEVDKWKVGEKYRIEMVVEQTSKHEHGGGFDIHQFGGTPERVTRKKVNND